MTKPEEKAESIKIISVNKKARFQYEIIETLEAGIVLTGAEIKSLREGKITLQESYVRPQNGEIHLLQAHIAQYSHDNNPNYEPARKRKLLLHKNEIMRLQGRVEAKGLTVVPLKIYLKN